MGGKRGTSRVQCGRGKTKGCRCRSGLQPGRSDGMGRSRPLRFRQGSMLGLRPERQGT